MSRAWHPEDRVIPPAARRALNPHCQSATEHTKGPRGRLSPGKWSGLVYGSGFGVPGAQMKHSMDPGRKTRTHHGRTGRPRDSFKSREWLWLVEKDRPKLIQLSEHQNSSTGAVRAVPKASLGFNRVSTDTNASALNPPP